MAQRASVNLTRVSMDSSFSEQSLVGESMLGSDQSSVAYLVYANRGDPYSAGYKQPSTKEIPQVKLPRVEVNSNLNELIESAKKISSLADLTQNQTVEDQSHLALVGEKVPEIFKSEQFKLDNPRIFDEVIGNGDSEVIQEKLSFYIDVVEAQLEHAIASSSTQFFSATSQFSQIEEQSKTTTEKIAEFAAKVEKQRELVRFNEETEVLKQKLEIAGQISEAIAIMEKFQQLVNELSENNTSHTALLNAQRFVEEQMLAGVDLSKVYAAQPLLEELESAEVRIRSAVANAYAQAMIEELRDTNVDADTKSKLETVDLLGARDLACRVYEQEIDREIIRVVKNNMPSDRPDRDSSPQPLARALHSLNPEEAEEMQMQIFSQVITLLNKLKAQVEKSNGVHSSNVILNAVHNVDNRIVRILRVRKDPVTSLDASQFLRFVDHVIGFCSAAKSATNGEAEATELYEFLVAQTKLYIHTMHISSEEELMSSMDSDDWRRWEIPNEVQVRVDKIVGASAGNMDANFSVLGYKDSGPSSRVMLDSEAFLISRSTARLVELIVPYLQLACNLPSHQINSLSTSLMELLRAYNNRLHHLILQFGATRTANLRHISVKNLVFSFECLRFVETLLTPIQQCFKRHLSSSSEQNQLGSAFDSVQQLYFDHRSEIQRRLVKLMSDKASAYARQISTIDWSQPTSGKPNKYMDDLMRQTTTVANVAQEMMSPGMAVQIVQEIYAVYKPKLLETYSSVQVHTIEEKKNVLRDLAFFKQKSEGLKGAGNTADVIYESVNGFVAPELPEVSQNLTVNSYEDRNASRRSLEIPEAIEADQSIAYTPEHEDNGNETIADNTHDNNNNQIEDDDAAKFAADKLEAQRIETERLREEEEERQAKLKEAAENEAKEREAAEKEAAEKEAAEKKAKEEAEREAKEKEEKLAKEAAEKAAKEKAEQEAKERAALEAKEKAEKEAKEKEEQEAKEKAAQEALAREAEEAKRKAAEQKAAEEAKKAAEEEAKAKAKAEAEKAEAAAKAVAEKATAEKAAAEKAAQEKAAQEAKESADKLAQEEAAKKAESEAETSKETTKETPKEPTPSDTTEETATSKSKSPEPASTSAPSKKKPQKKNKKKNKKR